MSIIKEKFQKQQCLKKTRTFDTNGELNDLSILMKCIKTEGTFLNILNIDDKIPPDEESVYLYYIPS